MTRYPSDRLHEEVAYLAFHVHWQLGDILALDHVQRRRWVAEVAHLIDRINETTGERSARFGR